MTVGRDAGIFYAYLFQKRVAKPNPNVSRQTAVGLIGKRRRNAKFDFTAIAGKTAARNLVERIYAVTFAVRMNFGEVAKKPVLCFYEIAFVARQLVI